MARAVTARLFIDTPGMPRYMRAYRFVEFLGSAVDSAGRSVAEAAHVEYDHSGGLASQGADTPSERVGQELLRQIARETDTQEIGRVEFTARALAPVRPEKRATPSPGGDLGILFQVDLPGYRYASGILMKSFYTPALSGEIEPDGQTIRERIADRGRTTPALFLFLVDDAGVRVVSGHAAAGIEDPLTNTALTEMLYSKSIGRFAQEYAEGFIGDRRLVEGFRYPEGTEDLDQELRAWASEYDLQGGLLIRVSLSPNREPASLRDFY